MTGHRIFLAAVLHAALAAPAARAEDLVVSLGAGQIEIHSNFTGAALSLVGVVVNDAASAPRAGGYDVVFTTRGPRGAVTVWEKLKFGPMWLNLDQRKYIAIPAFISVLSNRPLDAILPESQRAGQRIGIDALLPEQSTARAADQPEFRAALQRQRRAEGLFVSNEAGVRFVTPNVAQARIEIPGRAPLGDYNVEVALFADGALLARKEQSFTVTKAGLEQAFTFAARESSLSYGILTASLSLLMGWLASAVFRRD